MGRKQQLETKGKSKGIGVMGEYQEHQTENNVYSGFSVQLDAKNPLIKYQHKLPSVADFPVCYLSPQKTPGSHASSQAWCAMGHGWAPSSSWAPLSPTTATVATH